MKTSPKELEETFGALLLQNYASETGYTKLFKQFSSLALTAELRATLSPERNELAQQLARLQQILKLMKLRPSKANTPIDESFLMMGKEICTGKKEGDLDRDVRILTAAKLISYHRLAKISSLEAMATAIGMEAVAMLLEQSCAECRNSSAYLSQIEKNILYPQVLQPQS